MSSDCPPAPNALTQRIVRTIRDQGPISFARFMDLALYDPTDGYYACGAERLGREGDFFTASDAGRGLGRCLARQLTEVRDVLTPDGPATEDRPFDIVEFGSGRGLLARDILDTLKLQSPEFAERVQYTMVDASADMRRIAQASVSEAQVRRPEDPNLQQASYRGVVLANELFDALPVHRLRRRDGALLEVHVGLDDQGQLVEVESKPCAAAQALADRYGAAAEEGLEAEVCPAALAQLDRMIDTLERGVLILIDYGYPAEELYSAARARGTLLAYHGHGTNEDYLERIGEQDLTAHVNFTSLADRARERGLNVLGMTTQDRFLIANGLLEVFESGADEWSDTQAVKERLQAKQLIQPGGMGRVFKVLMLSLGVEAPLRLQGLADPFGRGAS